MELLKVGSWKKQFLHPCQCMEYKVKAKKPFLQKNSGTQFSGSGLLELFLYGAWVSEFFYDLFLLQICDELGVKRPTSVKVFSGKSESLPLLPQFLVASGQLPVPAESA
jgi:hypothetical protein